MFSADKTHKIVADYDKNSITIATLASHTSLQIFDGARKEGFRTLAIGRPDRKKFYDAFPKAKPDTFVEVNEYSEIMDMEQELLDNNCILIPHGSFVEYLGADNFANLGVPTFGNRAVLEWESDREKEREWLVSAGLTMPEKISDPTKINKPAMIKYHGAKGGRGFFIAKDYADFKIGIDYKKKYTIQEYILGTRYYIHYFYSPIKTDGYQLSKGTLEMLSIDRRDEANIDEMYKLGAQDELKRLGIFPTFVVTGNVPVVLRESLLPNAFIMGEKVVERSIEMFGGMIGPFCLETTVTDKLEFKVFEISARIVAGTNLFNSGSPYADLLEENMSTGRRIAREIKNAMKMDLMNEIIT